MLYSVKKIIQGHVLILYYCWRLTRMVFAVSAGRNVRNFNLSMHFRYFANFCGEDQSQVILAALEWSILSVLNAVILS
jgi:hypothetical protein